MTSRATAVIRHLETTLVHHAFVPPFDGYNLMNIINDLNVHNYMFFECLLLELPLTEVREV